MKRLTIIALTAAFMLAWASPPLAQDSEQQIPVYRLELREVPDIPTGKAALVSGNAGAVPDRFFLDHLYMLKPVSVTVRAVNPGDVVTTRITKEKWDDVLREGNTAQGQSNFKFRTQGEFQISITADKPNTPYKMVVWVGPDIVPKSRPVFVPESQFKGGGSSNQWLWWGGGAAGILLLAVLAFVFMRRKRAS